MKLTRCTQLSTLLITLTFALFSPSASAQLWDFTPPNYEEIQMAIEDKDSPMYYEVLMDRFREADTTMTLEERRHLYYGFVFQSNYSPYGFSSTQTQIREIFGKDSLTTEDYESLLALTDETLIESPFDLRSMDYQIFAYDRLQQPDNREKVIMKYRMVVDALLSSGDGTSMENAFYVITTTHEYDLIEILGFSFGGSQALIEHYDKLTLAENEAGIEAFYFDITPCLNHLSGMFDEDED